MLRRKHRERCNWMYWNIITQAEGQERSKDSISTVYLANLIETCDRCAVFRPSLGKVREAHLERLKQRREDAVDKVLQLNPTNDAHIETIAQDAVSHYHSLTHNELIRSLPNSWKVYYYGWYHGGRIAAALGLISTATVLYKYKPSFMKQSTEWIKTNLESQKN
ncbi:hypothetical protein PROFUN_06164 [Planoprotostelium fungivorum]|uniref:Uncharacterized protein n=1 Tax=Planoprotostelium fungivorum TaxID=1890364 RepID=A0A2P6NPJ9_9EUKA|nr:hypothetical protein PROFUN_06164 [Planoprotostelium fungivorum]